LDGPAADTDPNVAYTWGYGLSGSAATYARLEKITLPGGREVYYNYESQYEGLAKFASLNRVANIAANGSPTDAQKYVAYKYLGASMVVEADHPAVPGGLPEGPPSGRLTYAGSNKANAPWHGHLARASQGRPGRAVANSHGRNARVTHGQDAHATHGRDAHATPAYDQAGSNTGAPGLAHFRYDPNANPGAPGPAHFRYDPASPQGLRRAGAWNRLSTPALDLSCAKLILLPRLAELTIIAGTVRISSWTCVGLRR